MKRLLTLIISATLMMMTTYAQTGINYQAVARDNNGTEIQNRSIEVKFSILENSSSGTLVWEEKQSTTTNAFGLFTVNIGQTVNRSAGVVNFDSIKWGSGAHYLKVEVDFGDNSFINMGTTQMLAVPYALYAKTAGNASGSTQQITYDPVTKKLFVNGREVADFSAIGANSVQNINLNGNLLSYTQNGQNYTIDFSKYLDNTDRQNLSLKGHVLSIENGNSITLPDSVNEPQTLTLQGNKLRLLLGSKEYGSAIVDTDSTNEIQDIYEENNQIYLTKKTLPRKIDLSQNLTVDKPKSTLTINRGNTVYVDADTTNEIQQLSYTGKYISLSKNGGSVYDADTSKTNELITDVNFSDGDNLKITEAGKTYSANLSSLKNVPWEGFSYNNNSGVGIPGLQEQQISWNKEFDDGNIVQSNALTSTSNGATYSVSLYLSVANSSASNKIKFYKGSTLYKSFDFKETLSTSFLVKLDQGETLSISIQNTTAFPINIGSALFSGYRVH